MSRKVTGATSLVSPPLRNLLKPFENVQVLYSTKQIKPHDELTMDYYDEGSRSTTYNPYFEECKCGQCTHA
jgi:hypothetical protein